MQYPAAPGIKLVMLFSDVVRHKMHIRLLLLFIALFTTRFGFAQDSIIAIASHRYEHASLIERTFVGRNYRDVWSIPVRVKRFHLYQEKSGLTPKELGGGLQTRSLHLEDQSGQKWALRSVDKTVDKAMKAMGIKNPLVRHFSQQMISAAQPYGPLTLQPMAEAIGILNTQPEVVFVPDDPALGQYRALFANAMCLLEMEQPVFYEDDKVINTSKMLAHLEQDKDYNLDEKMMLQARLLDMLVADWDRHGDQWKWEVHRQGNGSRIIYPIPRDHDQAYFNSNGVVFTLIRLFNAHTFVGFRKAPKLRALNYKEWAFDKKLLGRLSEQDWRDGVQLFVARLTDEVLAQSVHRLPQPVYEACGKKMLRTLTARRDRMPDAVMRYYRFLQTHPRKIAKEGAMMQRREEKARKVKAEAAGNR
jgi:hypothetical protein